MRSSLFFSVIIFAACTRNEKPIEENVAPEITNMWVKPTDGITTFSQLYCVVNATDTNNNQLNLDYVWRNGNGDLVSDTWEFKLDPTIVQPDDELTCTATVDDGEFTVEQSLSVTVENTPPEIISIALSPEDVVNDSLLSCLVESTDADLETLDIRYSWMQGNTELGTESRLQLSAELLVSADPVSCTVVVEDGYGGSATDSIETTISNRAPSIDYTVISPENPLSIDTLTCSALNVFDIDGDDVTLTYTWSINGTIDAETSDILSSGFLATDVVSCSITPDDGIISGTTLTTEVTITNSLPSIDSLELSASSVTTDESISATVSTSDIDANHTVSVNYEWHIVDDNGLDTIVQSGTDSTLDSGFFVKGDTIYVVATPNDSLENGNALTSASIPIENTIPSNMLVIITSDNNFYNDSNLTCTATADDLDVNDGTDTLSYTYTWSTGDTGNTLTLDGSLVPNTAITCSVDISDGTDTVSGDTTSTLVNRAPSLSVELQQGLTAETTSLLCETSVADLDGTVPTLSYVWTVDGTLVSETSYTYSGPFVQGETIECAVDASDGIDTVSDSDSTTVGNSAPIADTVLLEPSTAYTNSILTVSATVSDVDTDQSPTASYEWHIVDENGLDTVISGQTGTSLSNSSLNEYFMKGDSVYVIVTPNDGVETGTSVQSSSSDILNTPPTKPNIIVYGSPSDPPVEGTDDLQCNIDTPSTDIDGDAINYTYEWTRDSSGSVEQITTGTTDVSDIFSGIGTITDTWTCTVVANDGDVDSAPASASVDVESNIVEVFVYGTIAGQDGWSGMTNSGGQPDPFPAGTMVSGDQNDRGDSIVGIGLPVEDEVLNGNKSWWFRRGYDSPGIGTPYSPNLNVNTTDSDGDGVPDQGFYYQVAFKAADQAGDDSIIAVITGDPAGADRASNYLAIYNSVGNLNIQTYSGGSFNVIVANLDTTAWHTLEAIMYRDGVLDYWTYFVNGVEVMTDEVAYFSDFRVANGFGYTESSRLKFQPRHGNQDASFQGFYFDDLITQTLDSSTGIIIDAYSTGFE